MRFITVLLNGNHERENFSCGVEELDHYLKNHAGQEVRKKVSACYIFPATGNEIQGYYTLSGGSVPRNSLPESIAKKLPKYRDLPVTILGRLAVDKRFQGNKSGQHLLMDALHRCFLASGSVGSVAVVTEPMNEIAVRFYKKYGFISLPDSHKMFMMLKTFRKDFLS